MAYNLKSARALCTGSELELVAASFSAAQDAASPARLKARIVRARRLRDKYRDLWRRQRLADRERTGTKAGARPGSNARTKEKAQLFDETLKRFERQWRRPAAAPKLTLKAMVRGALETKRVAKAPPAKRKPGKRFAAPRAGYVSEQALQASRRQRLQNTRAKSVQAHVRARGQRNQARRDSRPR
jgi:hypothetical protein